MIAIGAPQNTYVVIPPWSDEELSWNPFDPTDVPVPDCAYLSGVLVAMEQDRAIRKLTFYVTSKLDRLPSYGADVVAIVLSDEWCRIPRYAFEVCAVFKTYGTRLPINWPALVHPTPYELAALLQDLRTAIRRMPTLVEAVLGYGRRSLRGKRPAWRIFDIPLGYFRQVSVPYVPIGERRFDVYFGGSVLNRSTSKGLLQRLTPKFLSRAQMLDRLRRIARRHPELAIATALTASFMQTTNDEAIQYSQTMMETKICLVPRGTSLETYRFFEGLRVGCVVIAQQLPQRWFYDGSPALRVRTWSELDRLIPALLADPTEVERLSRASLQWWSERCSEAAVGAYVAQRLHRILISRREGQPCE